MPEFRIYLLEECMINPPPEPEAEGPKAAGLGAALLALFVPKLIETAISGVANALKKAGEDKTEQLKAEKRVPEDKAVGGVFEAMIRSTLDGTAFFLDTRHFSAREFIGDRRKDERAYVVTLSLSTPDATAEGSTFALGAINLGRLKKGDSLVPQGHPLDAFPRYHSNLMPWSKISEAAKEAYERDVGAGQAADGEKLYEEELKALLEVRKAEKAYAEAAEADKPVRKVELELARRRHKWQTALRKAAGLPDRPDVDSE